MRDPLPPLSVSRAVAEIIAALKDRSTIEVKLARGERRRLITSAALKREVVRAVEDLTAKVGPERFRHLATLDVQLKSVSADGVTFCVYR